MNVCLYQGKIWIPEFSKVGEAKANPDFNSKSSLGERQNSSGSTHFSFMEGAQATQSNKLYMKYHVIHRQRNCAQIGKGPQKS